MKKQQYPENEMDNSKGDVVIHGNVSRINRYVFDCLSNSFETREGKWEGRLTAFRNELSKQINAAGSRPERNVLCLNKKERRKVQVSSLAAWGGQQITHLTELLNFACNI